MWKLIIFASMYCTIFLAFWIFLTYIIFDFIRFVRNHDRYSKINIKTFDIETVELYSDKNKFIGWINKTQFLDVACQICEQKLDGYYVVTDDKRKIVFDNNGEWSDEVFTQTDFNLLLRLKQLQELKTI
jgi:hypothetical protein